jgi:hypothetical protein
MKLILPLLFIALVGLSPVTDVPVAPGEKLIQGTWHLEGNDGRGPSWYHRLDV